MHTKESIIALLESNDIAVARALVALTGRQTYDEKAHETTKYLNGMGFRPNHAKKGTSMAKFYLGRGFFTKKQADWWRRRDKNGNMRIGIYAGQLLIVAEEKAIRLKNAQQ